MSECHVITTLFSSSPLSSSLSSWSLLYFLLVPFPAQQLLFFFVIAAEVVAGLSLGQYGRPAGNLLPGIYIMDPEAGGQ